MLYRRNTIFYLLISFLFIYAQSQCSNYQFQHQYVPGKCLSSTSHPSFQLCHPPVIQYPNPNYCAVFPDDTFSNFTFPCQAYLEGATGYFLGSCTCQHIICPDGYQCYDGNCFELPSCDVINCGSGYQCISGKCVEIPPPPPQCTENTDCLTDEKCENGFCQPITCDDITCPEGETCQFLVCYQKYDYFCSDIQPQIIRHYCPLKRPDQASCPTKYYFAPPQNVCAVSYNGQLIDFGEKCEACKRLYIEYVYDQPCSSIPQPYQCSEGYECNNGNCAPINHCLGINCPQGKYCQNGVCLQKPGYCYGDHDCPYYHYCDKYSHKCEIYVDPCEKVQCSPYQKCVNGQCHQLCDLVQCPYGSYCKKGYCYVIDPVCTSNYDCPPNKVCIEGKCKQYQIPDCATVYCNPYQYCSLGVCYDKDPCSYLQCDFGCSNGACNPPPDPCSLIQCQHGCHYGKCLPPPDPCYGVICSYGVCVNGHCKLPPGKCWNHNDCNHGQICLQNKCKKVICQDDWQCYGCHCNNGYCYP